MKTTEDYDNFFEFIYDICEQWLRGELKPDEAISHIADGCGLIGE